MRRKRLTNSAMTLTELIIASVLVGIVTLGLIAAEQAVRMSRQSSNRDAQISAQLQAAMVKISKDASLTVGDITDTGIYQYAAGNDKTICFRQADGDANLYTDDKWNCWWADVPSGLLTSCDGLANPVTVCTGQPSLLNWVILKFEGAYLTFYSVFDDTATVITPANPWKITNQRISNIQIELKSRYNPALPENPIQNPEYILDVQVSPVGLSR